MRKTTAALTLTASLLTGGVVGLTVFGPDLVGAQTTPTSAAPPAAREGHHFGGPRHELGRAAAAKAIGISETDLTTALRSGKTIAQVAQAHNVDPKKVIDALVSDAKAKLADQVKNGHLTQAQADQIQTRLAQRVTDQVNGTFPGPGHDSGPRPGDGHPPFGPGRGWGPGPGAGSRPSA